MDRQVIIDKVTSSLHLMDGAAVSPETARRLVQMALEAWREEADHEQRVREERSLDNGYAERLGSHGR